MGSNWKPEVFDPRSNRLDALVNSSQRADIALIALYGRPTFAMAAFREDVLDAVAALIHPEGLLNKEHACATASATAVHLGLRREGTGQSAGPDCGAHGAGEGSDIVAPEPGIWPARAYCGCLEILCDAWFRQPTRCV